MSRQRAVIRWRLRQVMAAKGMFQTSELVPLLAEADIHLSRQYVHRLVTRDPQRVNVDLLAALCDILDCEPSELLELGVEAVEAAAASGSDTGPGIGDLRPIRARVRRPHDNT